jgi:hypothetical protein
LQHRANARFRPSDAPANAFARTFKSVDELEPPITDYLRKHIANPKPFKWTATALEKNKGGN